MFAIVADEMFFLPAWLDHHRKLGLEYFYILVDKSTDGTAEFLESQDDVFVMRSRFDYGDKVNISPLSRLGHKYFSRAGVLYPRAITDHLFDNEWSLYLDADEFLLLPPETPTIQDVIASLEGKSVSVPASNVIFFPARVNDLASKTHPSTFEELVREAPFFDARPLLDVQRGKQPKMIAPTKISDLTRQFLGISHGNNFKTPLIKHTKKNFRKGSHLAYVEPGTEDLLAVAHFVFTSNTIAKIDRAMNWKAHANESEKYFALAELMRQLSLSNHVLTSDITQHFENVEQLVDCGLMTWKHD